MFSGDWTPPCGSCCTKKYASLVQIPWRVFCKKGCNADGDTWDECCIFSVHGDLLIVNSSGIGKCTEICYKDPVLEDRQWSAYIDRSPGQDSYSLECFNACVSGCGFRFDIPTEKVEEIKPNRPSKPSAPEPEVKQTRNADCNEDVPCTSA